MSAPTPSATLPTYLEQIRQDCCTTLDADPGRLSRWRQECPALVGVTDATSAHAALGTPLQQRMSCGPQSDAALYEVLLLASGGDRVAAHLVLSSQLPWIAGCVRRHTPLTGDLAESISLYVSATLECAVSYPASRRRFVLRALHGLISRHVARATGRIGLEIPTPDPLEVPTDAVTIWGTVDHPRGSATCRALDAVAQAHDVGAITSEEAHLLVRSYIADDTAREDIAAELGISSAATRRRISQAVRRLAAYASLRIDTDAALDLLARALDAGALSSHEVTLLVREHLEGSPAEDTSTEMRRAIRTQVGHAIAKLASFVATEPSALRRHARSRAAAA